MHKEHVKQEEYDAHAQGKQRNLLGQAIELALQGALGVLHVLRQARDFAKLRRHADLRNDNTAVALGNRGSREHEVGRFGSGKIGLEHGVGGLSHRIGLAGKRRLVHLQIGSANNTTISRNLVAFC